MAKKRITELATETTLKDGQYVAIDHATDGTKKLNLGAELTDLKEDLQDETTARESAVSDLNAKVSTLSDAVTLSTYNNDQVPYLFRPSGGGKYIGGIEKDTIVGGTVAWNNLQPSRDGRSATTAYTPMFGIDGEWVYSVTIGNIYLLSFVQPAGCPVYRQNRKNFPCGYMAYSAPSVDTLQSFITKAATNEATGNFNYAVISKSETTEQAHVLKNMMFIDLTQMFGTTIADYIYSLEQATAGSGIAKLKSWGFFTEDYYPYDSGSLKNVEGLESHVMRDADENIIGNYPLDSNLTLRGIPKLDASNQLYYDGDTYKADGGVTRKYGTRAYQSGDESLTDAITDGTNTVYKLSTSTTETADPYQTPQIVDKYGTEEYVTTGIVPVGHDTDYYLDADSVLTPPSTAGTYSLKVTVASDGSKSYSWVSD